MEYNNIKESLLEEIALYLSKYIGRKVYPIAIEYDVFGIVGMYNFYYYDNTNIKLYLISHSHAETLSGILNKYSTPIDEGIYVSKNIVSKKLAIIDMRNNTRIEAIVYAIKNDIILYNTDNTPNNLFLVNNIKIDYTENNFNVIDNL